jgi:hypothetical protein
MTENTGGLIVISSSSDLRQSARSAGEKDFPQISLIFADFLFDAKKIDK